MHEAVKALALCHNVTPVRMGEGNGESESSSASNTSKRDVDTVDNEGDIRTLGDDFTYQASSPDEVRGLRMIRKDITIIRILSVYVRSLSATHSGVVHRHLTGQGFDSYRRA